MRTHGLLFFFTLAGCQPAAPPITGRVTEEPFHSSIVMDDYILRLRLPPGYDDEPARLYPLVVQLDPSYVGLHEFDTTAGLISQHAAGGEWPEAIVLGVDYPDPFTRERDYRPPKPPVADYGGLGADRFYRVLANEILPWAERKLRVDPAHRVLVGHSNGGVFAWYAAFREQSEPALFSGIVAADCGYDEALFTYQRWHAERSRAMPPILYASRAVYNGGFHEVGFRAMVERIERAGYSRLRFRAEELETDHLGAILPSFEHGLDLIFGGVR